MNILYLAFACNPYTGSEAQCGWSWAIGMRKYARVSVVTRTENKENIQRYLQEHQITDLKVYYCDVPKSLNIYYKTKKAYHLYYLMWQKSAYSFVKELHKKENYDIVHHVTLGDFRYLGPYWKLGVKVVFGPVGGAQLTPEVFMPYVVGEKKSENLRQWINSFVAKAPFYRKALNNTSLVLAANQETQSFLQGCMSKPEKCVLLTENGVQTEHLEGYTEKEFSDTTTLLWSGRMVNRKGLSFLLDAIRLIPANQKFCLILVGDGPEKCILEDKAKSLGLKEKVFFTGCVTYEEMQKFYKQADIFVFPSLRETTGTVLFEAMSNGLPVISFNQNGAKLLLDDSCGIRVKIDQSLSEIQQDFADAVLKLMEDKNLRKNMGRNAYQKIISQYVWEKKCEQFYIRYKYLKEE